MSIALSTTLIQIKHCQYPDQIVFECQVPDEIENKIKYAVETAIRQGKSLAYANLSHVNLRGTDLSSSNLAFADLRRANLSHADLLGVNLSGTNLASADLLFSNLSHAELSHADLSGADLTSSNLSHADLSGADLTPSNLSHADLYHASFNETNIDGETVSKSPLMIEGLHWPVFITEGYMRIGCQRHKHGEWNSFSDRQISEMDEDALEFWKKNKACLLMMCYNHSIWGIDMTTTIKITIEEFLNLPENLSVMRKFLSVTCAEYNGIWFVLRGNNIHWEERDFGYAVVNSGDILISDIDPEKIEFTNKECNFHDVVRKHRVPIFDIVKAKVYSPDFPDKTRLAWGDMSNLFADIFGNESCYWSDTDAGLRELLEKRFECHGIDTWMCTDTIVGTFAYFLNGVCIAVTYQSSRKSQLEVYWVNEHCYNLVRTAFEAIMLEKQPTFIVVADVSLCPYDISDAKLVRDLYPFFKEDEDKKD